jgi:hypothetical protein
MNFPGLTKPVTREDILWCCRYILRREPESAGMRGRGVFHHHISQKQIEGKRKTLTAAAKKITRHGG